MKVQADPSRRRWDQQVSAGAEGVHSGDGKEVESRALQRQRPHASPQGFLHRQQIQNLHGLFQFIWIKIVDF